MILPPRLLSLPIVVMGIVDLAFAIAHSIVRNNQSEEHFRKNWIGIFFFSRISFVSSMFAVPCPSPPLSILRFRCEGLIGCCAKPQKTKILVGVVQIEMGECRFWVVYCPRVVVMVDGRTANYLIHKKYAREKEATNPIFRKCSSLYLLRAMLWLQTPMAVLLMTNLSAAVKHM